MCNHNLDGKYEPQSFEEEIYNNWFENGYFKPNGKKEKGNYCIMMPPPNVFDVLFDILVLSWNFARYSN